MEKLNNVFESSLKKVIFHRLLFNAQGRMWNLAALQHAARAINQYSEELINDAIANMNKYFVGLAVA